MIDLDDVAADDGGGLTATAELPGVGSVTIEYLPEDDPDLIFEDDDDDEDDGDEREDFGPDVEHLSGLVGHALARLTPEILDARALDVVSRLTEEVGEDEDDDAVDREAGLAADLTLDGVEVVGDGTLSLLYLAADRFPGSTIRAQLGDDLSLEGVEVD